MIRYIFRFFSTSNIVSINKCYSSNVATYTNEKNCNFISNIELKDNIFK